MADENLTQDINTGNVIRKTDNTPKETDYFALADQHSRPLSEAEIKEAIQNASDMP